MFSDAPDAQQAGQNEESYKLRSMKPCFRIKLVRGGSEIRDPASIYIINFLGSRAELYDGVTYNFVSRTESV